MASFFGEVLHPRSRIIDDEDLDAIEEGYCEEFRLACQESFSENNLLIICEGPLPSAYTKLCIQNNQACGDVLAKSFNQDVSIGKIFRGRDWTVVTCEHDLKQPEFLNLANTSMSLAAQGCQIICLTARHVSEYRAEEVNSEESIVRCLSSKSFQHSDVVKRLEIPNILTGLSSAVLSIAIVKKIPCYLLVNYVDLFTPDSFTLEGFQNIHKLSVVQNGSFVKPNIAEALRAKKSHQLPSNLYI